MKADVTTDQSTTLVLRMESTAEKDFIVAQVNFAKDNNTTLNDSQRSALDQLAGKINSGV